ncbi:MULTISPECIES: hypothetical protein [Hymenobacter]|uniref:Uncharacterized protein n=1 Tax=Hymenobacter jejuensis TaxID=2502781 RepID=A0A5B7ZZK4_9BACT|nr:MULTISPECIES: hypothetical protein [Hymenobacter]MBC6992401.1 hypothetical protein [Hymenobacter sp. BT491]QDA60287.1 hypothetical protein FHG12_09265 [Hymenobacter jejuensis]
MLEMMVTKKIGRKSYHINATGTDLHELLTEHEKLSFQDVLACGLCGSDNLTLTSRTAQNKFKYCDVKCLDCRGSVTFGKRQDDDKTYFLRKKEGGKPGELDWQAFNPNATQE